MEGSSLIPKPEELDSYLLNLQLQGEAREPSKLSYTGSKIEFGWDFIG